MRRDVGIGLGFCVVGLAVVIGQFSSLEFLAWVGTSAAVTVAAWIAALACVVRGGWRLVLVGRERVSELWANAGIGLAWITLGVCAALMLDVTIAALPTVVGLWLLGLGANRLREVARGRDYAAARFRYGWRIRLRAGVAFGAALALVAAMVWFDRAKPTTDEFYSYAGPIPEQPGELIRVEPFDRAVPEGGQGWRLLYSTTGADGSPATASALVVAPRDRPQKTALPIVSWAHGTTGYASNCAPSLLPDPFEAGATPALPQVLDAGWAMVATDYIGLGTPGSHPYLLGEAEARSVIDATRAARQLDDVLLGEETVIWGHSQGGHAALWSGQLAAEYAPDLGLAGVAALAPASDLAGLVSGIETQTGGSVLASFVLKAYAAEYDDVEFNDYVPPAARRIMTAQADRCLAEPELLASLVTSLVVGSNAISGDPRVGPLGNRLEENTPRAMIEAPLLIAQGGDDELVTPAVQRGYVDGRCATGQPLEYREYPERNHLSLIEDESELIGDLMEWTSERFAKSAPTGLTC